MRSMTGFGTAALQKGGLSLRVEARSVNHRFLQVKVRLPAELTFLEPDVERLVRKRLDRGAVTVSVHLGGSAALDTVRVDTERARRYQRLLGKMAKDLEVPGELDLATLVGLPGVVGGEVDDKTLGEASRSVLGLVKGAVDGLVTMRAEEGEALAKVMTKVAGEIEKLTARIAKRMPKAVREHHANLARRVDELLGDAAAVEARDLAREVALIADRMDVAEELDRLESHLQQLGRLLAKKGAVGRQLDFLVQEFLREANTIGSKCSDATVSHDVVELKTRIERLREQVQNVE